MRYLGLWLSFFLSSTVVLAYDNIDQLMNIEPGMTKEAVLQLVGPPDFIETKSVDEQGKRIEVYRYIFVAPARETKPLATSFIKAPFTREEKSIASLGIEEKKRIEANPPYLVHFVDDVVVSIEKQ